MAPAVGVAEDAGEGRLERYGEPSGAWGERAAQGADAEDQRRLRGQRVHIRTDAVVQYARVDPRLSQVIVSQLLRKAQPSGPIRR